MTFLPAPLVPCPQLCGRKVGCVVTGIVSQEAVQSPCRNRPLGLQQVVLFLPRHCRTELLMFRQKKEREKWP